MKNLQIERKTFFEERLGKKLDNQRLLRTKKREKTRPGNNGRWRRRSNRASTI
jgi:hypothetical protein